MVGAYADKYGGDFTPIEAIGSAICTGLPFWLWNKVKFRTLTVATFYTPGLDLTAFLIPTSTRGGAQADGHAIVEVMERLVMEMRLLVDLD